MRLADTDVLLGLILPDRPQHAAFAEAATDADAAPVLITESVLVEAAGVLGWRYGYSRRDVAQVLLDAIVAPGVAAWDRKQAESALRLMAAVPSLGLVDCLLLERGLQRGEEVLTFDAQVRRLAAEYVEL